MDRLFNICVEILLYLGRIFQLTYNEISVILNLYIQGGVLALTGIAPSVIILSQMPGSFAVTDILILIYALINAVAFVMLLRHYHLPLDYSFNLCIDDLMRLVMKYKISYNALNIIIFVILWLIILAFNIFLIIKVI